MHEEKTQGENNMFRLNKDTTIGELLTTQPEMASILQGAGMHCLGCPSSQRETLEQAAEVHGLDVDDLLEELRGFMEAMM